MSSTTRLGGKSESIAWTISRRLGMVIVLALAFFMSATVTIYTLFRSGATRVPNVVGKPAAEAQKIAEQAGLKVRLQPRSDPSVPANSVIKTIPDPNSSVKKDSVLTIIVSSGPAQATSRVRRSDGLVCGLWFVVCGSRLSTFQITELQTTNHKPQTNSEPQTTNHKPRTILGEPQTTNHELRTS
ncbi:MAG TPA: PASTA domain-containing protein [Blastocatellia bacterium]|nr:PASTA domain-containing protein [Blastocatellia bacterium]